MCGFSGTFAAALRPVEKPLRISSSSLRARKRQAGFPVVMPLARTPWQGDCKLLSLLSSGNWNPATQSELRLVTGSSLGFRNIVSRPLVPHARHTHIHVSRRPCCSCDPLWLSSGSASENKAPLSITKLNRIGTARRRELCKEEKMMPRPTKCNISWQ